MAESRFNKVCNVLTKYNFDINEDIREKVACKICKKIMIDPYSGFCGCQYCYHCIKDYIGEDLKHCPGGTEECAEESLVMEINVHKNLVTRRDIFNMMIKCPNASCSVISKLENLDEHIRICTLTPIECPFETIGCINEGLREDNVKVHLDLDELKHTQMIVEAINHLKNDVNGLKHILEAKEMEIKEMKEEIENNKRQIEDMKQDSRKKEILMREEIDELKDVIRILKDNHERIKSQKEVMKEEEENEEMKCTMMTKEVLLNIKEDFVWTIKDFNNKINNDKMIEYLSDSFYKDDYKLCLQAMIGCVECGDGYVCFSVCILRGERDERAKWPMKHTITINIINQDSLKTQQFFIVDYDEYYDTSLFDKPQSNNNDYIYCGRIFYDDIKDIRGIIKDDSLTVGCSLSSK